jgi:hypothetical protein
MVRRHPGMNNCLAALDPITTRQQPASIPRTGAGLIQRQYACGDRAVGGACQECRKRREGTLQRAAIDPSPVHQVPPIVHEVLRSPGQSLDVSTRALMETRFGHDFSGVRVHIDAESAESARAVNALAYTVGQDMVFETGQYAPGTREGQRLLAHELTHVMQQGEDSCIQAKLQIGQVNDSCEREADRLADQAARCESVAKPTTTSTVKLQRRPDVGFVTHALDRTRGTLDDPSDDATGSVSWPLSFAVTSPLEARADVEVTGGSGDPCQSYQVGFLQTVHSNWLHVYYWGQSTGGGSAIAKSSAPVPIRDGEPGTMWYDSSLIESPTTCNTRVHPRIDDYPTIFLLPKVHPNSLTGQPNYLTGVRRGIGFVTTLVASGPGGVNPLRFFYWNYQMEIDFQPNHTAPNAAWPFTWKKNTVNLGSVHTGRDSSVPLFASASTPYNASITTAVNERR